MAKKKTRDQRPDFRWSYAGEPHIYSLAEDGVDYGTKVFVLLLDEGTGVELWLVPGHYVCGDLAYPTVYKHAALRLKNPASYPPCQLSSGGKLSHQLREVVGLVAERFDVSEEFILKRINRRKTLMIGSNG